MKPVFLGMQSVQGIVHYMNINNIVQIFQNKNAAGKQVTTISLSNGSIDVNNTPQEVMTLIAQNAG
jgi:hypothetical protein